MKASMRSNQIFTVILVFFTSAFTLNSPINTLFDSLYKWVNSGGLNL